MNDECVKLLNEFYHLIEFVEKAQTRAFHLEQELFTDLRQVLAL